MNIEVKFNIQRTVAWFEQNESVCKWNGVKKMECITLAFETLHFFTSRPMRSKNDNFITKKI